MRRLSIVLIHVDGLVFDIGNIASIKKNNWSNVSCAKIIKMYRYGEGTFRKKSDIWIEFMYELIWPIRKNLCWPLVKKKTKLYANKYAYCHFVFLSVLTVFNKRSRILTYFTIDTFKKKQSLCRKIIQIRVWHTNKINANSVQCIPNGAEIFFFLLLTSCCYRVAYILAILFLCELVYVFTR